MAGGDFVVHVNDDNFEEEVLKSDKPTLVDFWAPWCGPCVAMGSIIEEIAEEYKDKAKIVKLNVDDSPTTAGNYGIRGIPTLLLFKDGELEETLVGLTPKDRLEDLLKKVL
ncbi:MAG: thioredoxin [Syntrophobacterales bacterium]|jgi:thioredoxin 1|nr:MAG: thioredoxin [Syntrophobacterales bacterium]